MAFSLPTPIEFGNGERKVSVTFMPIRKGEKLQVDFFLYHKLFKSVDFGKLLEAFNSISTTDSGVKVDLSIVSESFANFFDLLSEGDILYQLFYRLAREATVIIPGKPAQVFSNKTSTFPDVVDDFLDYCDDDLIVFKFMWSAIERQSFFPLGIPLVAKNLPGIKKVLKEFMNELGGLAGILESPITETTDSTKEENENLNNTVGILGKLSKSRTG